MMRLPIPPEVCYAALLLWLPLLVPHLQLTT